MAEQLSSAVCFGGKQDFYRHKSAVLGCDMTFSVFTPPGDGPFPVLWFLSGLTCTADNATTKAGFQRVAAELGLIIICPDTSPRGADIPDDPAYDFGQGAAFYINAVAPPWHQHFHMYDYVVDELPALIAAHFPADMTRQAITGHSMGGHGALTIAQRCAARFISVSAFSPIVAPTQCPWGQKAFRGYLGADQGHWQAYDACALMTAKGAQFDDILIDQGLDDAFLGDQLKPQLFQAACDAAGQPLTLRMQPGYDHSYYFITSFMEDHLHFHARKLLG